MASSNVRPLRRTGVRAGIYVRVSSDGGGSQAGRDDQERACQQLAETLGWTVITTYVDNDLIHTGPRTGYARLCDDIAGGVINGVITFHLDRLRREASELETFVNLADEHKTKLATATGEVDLATRAGRTYARQIGTYARHAHEQRQDSVRARYTADAAAGAAWQSGSRCYGYAPDGITIIDDEAAVIRDVAARLAAGESLRSVTNQLNAAGVKTARGLAWHPSTLKRLITNPRLIGLRMYQGKPTKGEWQPILTPAAQRKVAAKLDTASKAHTGKNLRSPRSYVLSGGLLVCGICGNTLSAQPTGEKRGYICRPRPNGIGCGRIRVRADVLEAEVVERVLGRLASPQIRRRLGVALNVADGDGNVLLDRIHAKETELAQLGRDYADGVFGRTEFAAASQRINEQIEQLRVQARAAARFLELPEPTPESLAEWWETHDIAARRDLLSTVLDHVVVGPATRRGPGALDVDRLNWVWRTN